ncbi:hypothetical protein F5879DRAFT_250924 [Lentinula edodes]|uniref:DUF6593 domain-containing protein n=1 Tax=Lentinula edodes TaxID=5353 RepID=A0A1Q3E8F6_LENED|nr:uncharacterized protein C8R40DRAFT_1038007 [Lentinula edodes]KAF8830603.1 hypothetical protein HHX47_DHR2001161 [Lentinula edodes]KAH7878494.1 hypothetical protein C8R40DRAFT_1038007 [Lentinula edodes]KAJ3908836.1 hypothetical protein F5879DRAFT_250924 [Lentinula edodes]KAJ3922028.1 hypothetical protein F5877DRAFT_34783 [Lentinula edodes]GAW03502.1 hypothetical protein LENED_005231 [Lentinula edodes]
MSTNPFFSAWAYGGDARSSLYGALPAPDSTTSDFQMLYFTSMNPNILSCTLTKADGQPQYYITTDSWIPGYTNFRTVGGQSVVLIEWNSRGAEVEIRGTLKKQYASDFLQLSRDRRFRIMTFGGEQYAWVARDNTICMYKVNSSSADCLARLCKEQGIIRLEMSPIAIRNGLLSPTVLAAVLLQGGRRID